MLITTIALSTTKAYPIRIRMDKKRQNQGHEENLQETKMKYVNRANYRIMGNFKCWNVDLQKKIIHLLKLYTTHLMVCFGSL